jgi:hypothetical protein
MLMTTKAKAPAPEQKELTDTSAVLVQRGSVHGKFGDNATFHEYALAGMQNHREGEGWKNLSARQKLALDVIQQKVARILSGDANFVDHWVDIEGYAKLVRINLETGEDR